MRVLSIDGGGVRAILPARALVELEALSGRPVAEQFDLIAGSSTGAVLALALTTPGPDGAPLHSAEDVLAFQLSRGSGMARGPAIGARLGAAVSGRSARGPLRGPLASLLGEAPFGDALAHLVVPSFDLEAARPLVFRSPEFAGHPSPLMRDVAEASSTNPARHRPIRLQLGGSRRVTLVHGALAASNPILLAYAAALTRPASEPAPTEAAMDGGDPPLAIQRSQAQLASAAERGPIRLLSLGVGSRHTSHVERATQAPLRGWRHPRAPLSTISSVLDGYAHATDQAFRDLSGATRPRDRYWRIQGRLDGCNTDMHDPGRATAECLLEVAEEMVAANRDRLAEAASALSA